MFLLYSNQIFQKISDIQIICEMQDEETDNKFVVYTANKSDEQGNLIIYAAKYDKISENKDIFILNSITDENQWKIINKTINELLK